MKVTYSLLTFVLLFLLTSCERGSKDTNQQQSETPTALKEGGVSLKRYGGNDLVEELYQELVDKSPDLEKLEEEIKALGPRMDDLNDNFQKYAYKSDNYYSAAKSKAIGINDSLLEKKMISLISKSSNQYSPRKNELESLLALLAKKETTLRDHHSVLKIVLTLPLIEKYQKAHFPNVKEHQDLMSDQEKLIQRTDSLTPKY